MDNKINEIWKDIPGYEGIYAVSDHGQIKTYGRINKFNRKWDAKYLKLYVDNCGYHPITLCKDGKIKRFRIHRLVAKLFVQNPDNYPHVNHKDGNKLNNHYANLEWVTPKQNCEHAWKNGLIGKTHARGENHPCSKLTRDKVNEIRKLYSSDKYTTRQLAQIFGLKGHRSILDIIHYKTWKHIL